MITKGTLVTVKWKDAAALPGAWYSSPETLEPINATTTGYLVKKNRKLVILAISKHSNGYGGLWVIPMSWVTKICRVKP